MAAIYGAARLWEGLYGRLMMPDRVELRPHHISLLAEHYLDRLMGKTNDIEATMQLYVNHSWYSAFYTVGIWEHIIEHDVQIQIVDGLDTICKENICLERSRECELSGDRDKEEFYLWGFPRCLASRQLIRGIETYWRATGFVSAAEERMQLPQDFLSELPN